MYQKLEEMYENMEKKRKVTALFSVMYTLMCATMIIAPVFSGPPYYHEEGNVNYPGSYFESVYNEKGIGVDDYITIVDIALLGRAYGTFSWQLPWGVGSGLYNPDADIEEDGVVEGRDLALITWHYGLNYHYSPFEAVPGRPRVKAVAPKSAIQVGQQFTVDIDIVHVEGLNTYEFTLRWNPNLLMMISVVGGGFISEEGEDLYDRSIIGEDYLYVGDLGETQSGSGTLAKITFECLDKGKTTLDLSSRLFDVNLNSMPHKDSDGVVKQRP